MGQLRKQSSKRERYKFVSIYPVRKYRCGLKAGDQVRLKKGIVMRDHTGRATGKAYPSGQVWTVLPGARGNPTVVWLRQADGCVHTWDDHKSIFRMFEIVESFSSKREKATGLDTVKEGREAKSSKVTRSRARKTK